MSIRAYIAIQTSSGLVKEVKNLILEKYQNQGVKSADVITGPYDLILEVACEDSNELYNLDAGILNVEGVNHITTMQTI